MNELLTKIKSDGHWRVVIHPTNFVEDRVPDLGSLQRILEKTSVQLNGWYFPHIDGFRELDKGSDWVGQEIVCGEIHELWRFYQSGQFVHYFAIPEVWKTVHRQTTPDNLQGTVWSNIRDFVARFTEIFELASRLTFTQAGDVGTHLEILVDNIRGHRLFESSMATKAGWVPESSQSCWSRQADFSSIELVAGVNELALEWASEFFNCFTAAPGIKLLKEAQSEFLMRLPR